MRRGIWCPRHPDEALIRIDLPNGKFDLRCPVCHPEKGSEDALRAHSTTQTTAPTVKSIMDWSVGLNQSNGRSEVRFELTDPEELKAWFQWLLDRCEDATDEL